jgi:hypothetical protein
MLVASTVPGRSALRFTIFVGRASSSGGGRVSGTFRPIRPAMIALVPAAIHTAVKFAASRTDSPMTGPTARPPYRAREK